MSSPAPTVAAGDSSAPQKKRGSGTTILACLLVPALAFATTLPPWITAKVSNGVNPVDVTVPGTDAAPAVSALALVALAGVVAARIAGPVLRAVICAVIALSGLGMSIAALTAVRAPEDAAMASVGKSTGTVGSGGEYHVQVWPWLTLVLGVAVVLMAVGLWLASRRWPTNRRRYERSAQHSEDRGKNPHADDIDAWDSLSEGRDPTDLGQEDRPQTSR